MSRQSSSSFGRSMELINEDSALLTGNNNGREPSEEQPSGRDRIDTHDSSVIPNLVAFAHLEDLQEQLEEFASDMLTFEPTDPEELLREVEDQHNHQHQHRSSALETLFGIHPADESKAIDHDDDDGHIEEHRDSHRESQDINEILTYPEEQMIESHFTSSPEKLGVVSLAVLVFYNVSGGPFGMETTVRAGGNLYAILGFLIMPFVWSLQEALMTAELGTTFVEASGGVAWVEEAFGERVGWIAGYLGWIAGATDNAIYPVLFLDYLLQVSGQDRDSVNPVLRFSLLSMTSICLAYINWRGLPAVGKMSVTICLLAMSPFLILIVVGSFKIDPSRWLERPIADMETVENGLDDDIAGGFFPNSAWGGVLWRPFLNNLFWNLNSFDAAGSLVAELDNPSMFLPSMMWGVFLVFTCYLLPLLVAIGSSDSGQTDWTNGYLATINSEVVGPWLGAWTVFAAGISNVALFQAELSSDAFQLMGMADRGHLPKICGKRSKHGTPTYGIILGTAVIVVMGVSDLDQLIEMLNFNYAIALLLEYAAFFKLRISQPNLERPFRIPLNTSGCALFFFPAIVATLILMSLATYTTYYFALGASITGLLVYCAKQKSERRKSSANIYEHLDGSEETTTAGDTASIDQRLS